MRLTRYPDFPFDALDRQLMRDISLTLDPAAYHAFADRLAERDRDGWAAHVMRLTVPSGLGVRRAPLPYKEDDPDGRSHSSTEASWYSYAPAIYGAAPWWATRRLGRFKQAHLPRSVMAAMPHEPPDVFEDNTSMGMAGYGAWFVSYGRAWLAYFAAMDSLADGKVTEAFAKKE